MTIAVAGLGYVGMSVAVLLAQHNRVVALDVNATRVAQVNDRRSPIEDAEITRWLAEKPLPIAARRLNAYLQDYFTRETT